MTDTDIRLVHSSAAPSSWPAESLRHRAKSARAKPKPDTRGQLHITRALYSSEQCADIIAGYWRERGYAVEVRVDGGEIVSNLRNGWPVK